MKTILFDLDGTITDSGEGIMNCAAFTLEHFGLPVPERAVMRQFVGPPLRDTFIKFGVPADKAEEAVTVYRSRYLPIGKYENVPYPGIYELLDHLDAVGIPAAITSSSTMENICRHLSDQNLCHRFAQLCSGHDVPNGKPAPDIYLHGAASLGLRPEECLALEDSPTGILAAYRAGCVTVMIPDLDQPDGETEKLLFAKADSLLDVIGLLD